MAQESRRSSVTSVVSHVAEGTGTRGLVSVRTLRCICRLLRLISSWLSIKVLSSSLLTFGFILPMEKLALDVGPDNTSARVKDKKHYHGGGGAVEWAQTHDQWYRTWVPIRPMCSGLLAVCPCFEGGLSLDSGVIRWFQFSPNNHATGIGVHGRIRHTGGDGAMLRCPFWRHEVTPDRHVTPDPFSLSSYWIVHKTNVRCAVIGVRHQ